VHRVDFKTRQVSTIPGSAGMFSPRISPDGRYITAFSVGEVKLMLYDTISAKWSLMTQRGAGGNEWSHDSKYVYMADQSRGFPEVVRINIRSLKLESMLNLRDMALSSDWFADWQGVGPDGSVLVMRDKSIEEVYALDLQPSR